MRMPPSLLWKTIVRPLTNFLEVTPLRYLIPSWSIPDPSYYYPEGPLQMGHSFKPVLETLVNTLAERKGTPLRALEWGPGMNTYVLMRFCNNIISIESNKLWAYRYQRMFRNAQQVEIHYIPFSDDPKGKKRYPGEHFGESIHYIAHPESYEPECDYVTWPAKQFPSASFDVIFVDGAGYRRDCLRVAKQLVTSEGFIMLHDYPREDSEQSIDMPSGMKYEDVVKEFQFALLCSKERTSVLSDVTNWFVDVYQ